MFEFPRHLLSLLRCSSDAGELICNEIQSGNIGVIEGTLHCSKCSEQYYIANGIVRLLKAARTAETLHKMNLRDSQYSATPLNFVPLDSSFRSILFDAIEIPRIFGCLNR